MHRGRRAGGADVLMCFGNINFDNLGGENE